MSLFLKYTVRPLFKKFTQPCETYEVEPTNCCVRKLHNLCKIYTSCVTLLRKHENQTRDKIVKRCNRQNLDWNSFTVAGLDTENTARIHRAISMLAFPWCTGRGVWYRPMTMHVWTGPEGSYCQSGFVPLKRIAKSASWYNYDPYFSCKIGMWSLFKMFSNLSLHWP